MAPAAGTGKQYPTAPVETADGLKFKIAIIADLDANAKGAKGKFFSYYKTGSLYLNGYNSENPAASNVKVEWDAGEPAVIQSTMNLGGRGMELSELNVYKGQLYAMDDRTGVVFRLLEKKSGEFAPIPWVILGDGDGTVSKGMKCEWGCVKGDDFWVGSTGMPIFGGGGEIVNVDTRWVKRISPDGAVSHEDWRDIYERLAKAMGISAPGYVKHESGGWSDNLKRWVFLPRRACKEAFNGSDELMGTNVILLATENFDDIEVRYVGDVVPSRGFSSFKWIPGTDDQLVVALKTVECGDVSETYLLAFDMQGKIIVPETKIADQKYEGIEFV